MLDIRDAVGLERYGLPVAQTVLAHLLRCGISESQAREHLAAGQVRVNCVPVIDADAELPDVDDAGAKPTVLIYPF